MNSDRSSKAILRRMSRDRRAKQVRTDRRDRTWLTEWQEEEQG